MPMKAELADEACITVVALPYGLRRGVTGLPATTRSLLDIKNLPSSEGY